VAREENAQAVQKAWKKFGELLKDPKYDLVIFDEIHIALKYKFLKSSEVINALKKRPAAQHVNSYRPGAPQRSFVWRPRDRDEMRQASLRTRHSRPTGD